MCEKSCHSKRDNRYPILFCNPFDESGVCYYKCEEKFSEWFTEHKLQKAQKDKRKRWVDTYRYMLEDENKYR